MGEIRWFKVWGTEVLASVDLNSLTDHEERVWWRLLAAASTQEPRWTIRESLALARLCVSTPAKLGAALDTFEARGMIRRQDGVITLVNAERYQETPAARRKREQRERDKSRDLSHSVSRDMSHSVSRGMSHSVSRDTGVTSHTNVPVTGHALVPSTRIAREAEGDLSPNGERERDAPDGAVALSPRERDLAEALLLKCPQRIQRDPVCRDEAADFARDFPGMEREMNEAVSECRRRNEFVTPQNVRKYMPLKPLTERPPTLVELDEMFLSRPVLPRGFGVEE